MRDFNHPIPLENCFASVVRSLNDNLFGDGWAGNYVLVCPKNHLGLGMVSIPFTYINFEIYTPDEFQREEIERNECLDELLASYQGDSHIRVIGTKIRRWCGRDTSHYSGEIVVNGQPRYHFDVDLMTDGPSGSKLHRI